MYSAKRLKNLQHLTPYSKTKEKEDQNIRCSSTKTRNFKSCWCSESRSFPTFSVDFRPHLWQVDKVEALRVLLAHPSEAKKQNLKLSWSCLDIFFIPDFRVIMHMISGIAWIYLISFYFHIFHMRPNKHIDLDWLFLACVFEGEMNALKFIRPLGPTTKI